MLATSAVFPVPGPPVTIESGRRNVASVAAACSSVSAMGAPLSRRAGRSRTSFSAASTFASSEGSSGRRESSSGDREELVQALRLRSRPFGHLAREAELHAQHALAVEVRAVDEERFALAARAHDIAARAPQGARAGSSSSSYPVAASRRDSDEGPSPSMATRVFPFAWLARSASAASTTLRSIGRGSDARDLPGHRDVAGAHVERLGSRDERRDEARFAGRLRARGAERREDRTFACAHVAPPHSSSAPSRIEASHATMSAPSRPMEADRSVALRSKPAQHHVEVAAEARFVRCFVASIDHLRHGQAVELRLQRVVIADVSLHGVDRPRVEYVGLQSRK